MSLEQRLAIDGLIAWLERSTLEERHCLALNWNWAYDVEPLQSIADKTDSALETMAFIFWRGNPIDYLLGLAIDCLKSPAALERFRAGASIYRVVLDDFDSKIASASFKGLIEYRSNIFKLLSTIVQNCEAGAYPRQGYAIDVSSDVKYYRRAELGHGDTPVKIPPLLLGPFEGRTINESTVSTFLTHETMGLLETFNLIWLESDVLPPSTKAVISSYLANRGER